MTKLEEQVSKLLSPEPWKHKWRGGECACGANVNFDEPILHPCTVPDPYKIPTDPDAEGYAKCLGEAIKWFRKIMPSIKICMAAFRLTLDGNQAYSNKTEQQFADRTILWLLTEATAEQLWSIVIEARKKVLDK